MSISIADASVTPLPSASASVHANAEMIFFWVCVGWAALGLIAAWALRAFRRRSIVGPVRIDTIEDAGYLFFIGLFAYLIAMLVGSFFAAHSSLPVDLKQQLLQVVIFATLCAAIITTLAIVQPQSLKRIGLHPAWIPAGIIGGSATLFIIYPLIQITGDLVLWMQELLHQPQPQAHELLLFLGKNRNPWWRALGLLSAVIVAPMTEELLFRGLIQTTLGRVFAWSGTRPQMLIPPIPQGSGILDYSAPPLPVNPGPGPRWAAVLLTAALFAAIHLSIPFFLPLFVLAIALGYIYERTGNLWMNIATHSLFNAGQIFLFLATSR